MTSEDGKNWTLRSSVIADNNTWTNLVFANNLWVAVSTSTSSSDPYNLVMISSDGITWEYQKSPSLNSWYGLAYGNNVFVSTAISGQNPQVMISP